MKCGREVALGQVFCKDCQADMAQYPIKPGTPVILPNRDDAVASRRTSTRKVRKPEEQVARLRKLTLGLGLALITLALAFGITTSVLLDKLADQSGNDQHGQNYSTEGESSYTG